MMNILPCPNPECGKPCHYELDFRKGYVLSPECLYTGPLVDADVFQGTMEEQEAEAIRLHNLLCRPTPQPTREAAEWMKEAAQSASEIFCNYTREENQTQARLERLILAALSEKMPFAHPPKPEPTEAVATKTEIFVTALERLANAYAKLCKLTPAKDNPYAHPAYEAARALIAQNPYGPFPAPVEAPKPPAEWMEMVAEELTKELGYSGDREKFVAYLVKTIAKHYTAPAEGWIKCSDRLPEIGEEVQVYCIESVHPEKPRVKALARFIPYEEATTYYWDSAYGGGNRHTQQAVIAWQPLAAAPKS